MMVVAYKISSKEVITNGHVYIILYYIPITEKSEIHILNYVILCYACNLFDKYRLSFIL